MLITDKELKFKHHKSNRNVDNFIEQIQFFMGIVCSLHDECDTVQSDRSLHFKQTSYLHHMEKKHKRKLRTDKALHLYSPPS